MLAGGPLSKYWQRYFPLAFPRFTVARADGCHKYTNHKTFFIYDELSCDQKVTTGYLKLWFPHHQLTILTITDGVFLFTSYSPPVNTLQ